MLINKIHSKYSFQVLFSFISEKRKYKLIQNNSYCHKKLDICLLDYKRFFFQQKFERYDLLYIENYFKQMKKDFIEINDDELKDLILYILSKKENFNLKLSDENFDLMINNSYFKKKIKICIDDLTIENIPKILLIKDNNLIEKANKAFKEIFLLYSNNNRMNRNKAIQLFSKVYKINISENNEIIKSLFSYDKKNEISIDNFLQFFYKNINYAWITLFSFGYNNLLEKNKEIDLNYIINHLQEFEENKIFSNFIQISKKKIYNISSLIEHDIIFLKYLNQKEIFQNVKKLNIVISCFNVIIKLKIICPNVNELTLDISGKEMNYNKTQLNYIFPNMKTLNIYIEKNFDLYELLSSLDNIQIETLKLFIIHGNITFQLKKQIILKTIKTLEINIKNKCNNNFLFQFLHYFKFPSLREFILFANFNEIIHQIKKFILNETAHKFCLKSFFDFPNKVKDIRYIKLNLTTFNYTYKKIRNQNYFFKFNLKNKEDLLKYYSSLDLSIDENEIIKYKKIKIKGLDSSKDISSLTIKEKKLFNLCDICVNNNQKEYCIRSFSELRSIYCENINQTNELLEKLNNLNIIFDKLKYINLTIGNVNQFLYNHFSNFLSKTKNLKSIILRLNPQDFNEENIGFFLSLIENLKKVKIVKINQNSENSEKCIIPNILEQYPKIKHKFNCFNKFVIGGKEFIKKVKKNTILNSHIQCIYEVDDYFLGKECILLGNEDLLNNNIQLYLDFNELNQRYFWFTNKGKHKLTIIFKELLTDTNRLFFDAASLKKINLTNLNTNYVENMNSMFQSCSNLVSLDLSNFNTSKVTDMSWMFAQCYSLKTLDLSSFNTSKVSDMSWMFFYCYSLQFLDLSNFNTHNVINMIDIFYCINEKCEIITTDKKLLNEISKIKY